jgi:hypothetical protein
LHEERPNLLFQLFDELGVVFEESAEVFPALGEALTLMAVPGAALLNEPQLHANINNFADTRNTFTV